MMEVEEFILEQIAELQEDEPYGWEEAIHRLNLVLEVVTLK